MTHTTPTPSDPAAPRREGITAPFAYPVFRRIWLAGLLSNLGLLVQGVGAAWMMVQLSSSADMVALVQTAQMAPVMLFALASGALADMYDRRIVTLVALAISFLAASALAVAAWLDALTPMGLLAFCFLIGSGMSLLWPAWQASVREQVPAPSLPSAVALNSISYNLARSVGPAIGGAIVAAAGAAAAFVVNACLYVPLIVVLFNWRRVIEPPRLPPEGLGRAMVSGVRYVIHSPPTRTVLTRSVLTGGASATLMALLPLVASELLEGGATIYGLLLGAFGGGAVFGALNIARVRSALGAEDSVRLFTVLLGLAIAVVALSPSTVLTALALLVAGASFMLTVTTFNIAIQVSAPRWVTGRALAAFQAAMAGGMAMGSWGWGLLAEAWSIEAALVISACAVLALPLIGLVLKMPPTNEPGDEALEGLADPEVALPLTGRSGPILVEIDYRVDTDAARAFYRLMQEVRLGRQRSGGYNWSLSRDIADPTLWTESYSCPTWMDYLRQRSRATRAERELYERARDFNTYGEPLRVRRRLERPFGSVRWREEAPDPRIESPEPTRLPGSP